MPSYSLVANGNISPSRFVKRDTTTAGRCLQCGAGDQVHGVSGQGTRFAPYGALDDGLHAAAGENCVIHGPPEKNVMLELGGTVVRGDFLKADANGKGVKSSADQEDVGGIAEDSGVSGELIPVQLLIMERSTA